MLRKLHLHIPCTTSYDDGEFRRVVTPAFRSPDTCCIYRVLACTYAKLCRAKELFAGIRGENRTFLRANHPEESVDCKLEKWCRTDSILILGVRNDAMLQREGGSEPILTLRTAQQNIYQ